MNQVYYDAYYKSNITGNIITFPFVIDQIYGKGAVEKLIDTRVIARVDSPTVIDILKSGLKVTAVKRYREIHGCTLSEAKDMVEKIMDDIGMPRY